MNKKNIEEIVKRSSELAGRCALNLNLEIVEVEYVKERGINILRIIADSATGLTIDEASDLNMAISDDLDKYDFIPEEYYLEVSSVGLEKPLKNDADITNSIGKYICISFYEKYQEQKEWYGDLLAYDGDIITLKANAKGIDKTITIDKNKINKIRLAVKF